MKGELSNFKPCRTMTQTLTLLSQQQTFLYHVTSTFQLSTDWEREMIRWPRTNWNDLSSSSLVKKKQKKPHTQSKNFRRNDSKTYSRSIKKGENQTRSFDRENSAYTIRHTKISTRATSRGSPTRNLDSLKKKKKKRRRTLSLPHEPASSRWSSASLFLKALTRSSWAVTSFSRTLNAWEIWGQERQMYQIHWTDTISSIDYRCEDREKVDELRGDIRAIR